MVSTAIDAIQQPNAAVGIKFCPHERAVANRASNESPAPAAVASASARTACNVNGIY